MLKINHSLIVAAIVAMIGAGACESCTNELSYSDARWFDVMGHEYVIRDSIAHANMRDQIDDYTDVIDDGDYIVAKENYVGYPSESNWKEYQKANTRLLRDEVEYLNK